MAVSVPVVEKREAVGGVVNGAGRDGADASLEAIEGASDGASEDVLQLELLIGVAEVDLELESHIDVPVVEIDGLVVELRRIRNASWRGRGGAASDLSAKGRG